MDDPLLVLRRATQALSSYAYRYANEEQLHQRIEAVLDEAGIGFDREVILDPKNRVDFMLEAAVVVEVKIDGSLNDALRQVDRYIGLDTVRGVLLVSARSWGSRPLVRRPTWGGKPFGMVYARRQAL